MSLSDKKNLNSPYRINEENHKEIIKSMLLRNKGQLTREDFDLLQREGISHDRAIALMNEITLDTLQTGRDDLARQQDEIKQRLSKKFGHLMKTDIKK